MYVVCEIKYTTPDPCIHQVHCRGVGTLRPIGPPEFCHDKNRRKTDQIWFIYDRVKSISKQCPPRKKKEKRKRKKNTSLPTPLDCRRTSEQSTTTCNNTLTFSLLMMGHSRLPQIRAAGKYGYEGTGPHFFGQIS